MSATLMRNTRNEKLAPIWVIYEAYTQGCYRALKEYGKDIPLVSVDICNMDIQLIKILLIFCFNKWWTHRLTFNKF